MRIPTTRASGRADDPLGGGDASALFSPPSRTGDKRQMMGDAPISETSRPAVRLSGIDKSFGAAKILNNIDLEFAGGSVHALIGENGAGKSSVGKIIGGYYSFDAGTLEVFGEKIERSSPRYALQRGV